MWLLFAVLTVLFWGTSEVIFKSASDSHDDNNLLKLISYNGIILGICAVVYMLIKQVGISWEAILKYLPISAMYIASMFFCYKAMPLIKVSILSPIINSSCALTTFLCIIVLHQELTVVQVIAIIMIIISIILLSINKDEAKDTDTEKQKKNYKIYVTGLLFGLGYWILDGIASFMDDYTLDGALSADEVILAFSFIYCFVGIVCYIILKTRDRNYRFNSDKKKLIGSLIETAGQYTYIYAYAFGEAAIASPFIASFSIISLILSRIFLKEKLSIKQYALIVIIFIGMIVLSME